ncbi:hypoxia inducible factor 1 subunit alpha, like 2 [Hoplias malabaricus]|uniref:hypoxia inducible factor 1 subunit alpha, like 2 n=1 Tax=Hoplias malabaricus TaxID=27720 RepID=UPI0034631457
MITKHLQTVLKAGPDHKLNVKQKCKQNVSEQKKARVCTEWRKARSRVAARSRREKESQLFKEIAALLPLAPNLDSQLDKASVIRLTISYLRLRALLNSPASSTAPVIANSQSPRSHQDVGEPVGVNDKWYLNRTLGRFLLIMSLNGRIIFTTKDVTTHTGINQMDLIGRSLFDFMHPCDQKELKEILTKLMGSQEQQKCDVFLRIKGATNHKLTPWKVVHCTGVKKSSFTPGCSCLLLLCRSLPVQDVIERESYLNSKAFLSIHRPDMKFTFCHSRVLELTGFRDTELHGQSVYQYYHPSDCQHILKAHNSLLAKGQVCTGKYRLLQKHGGYVWVETDATVVYNIRTGKPESVVCINYILSEVEMADVVFSLEQTKPVLKSCDLQLIAQPTPLTTTSTNTDKHTMFPDSERDGVANGHLQIMQKSPACNSLTCEICELDLDILAPFIPMDEEDFQLTPPLDSVADSLDLNRYFTRPCISLDPDNHLHLETTPEGTLPTSPHTDSYFSLTNRFSKDLPDLISSRQRHNTLYTMNGKQQVEGIHQTPSFQNKTNQRTGISEMSQHVTKGFRKNVLAKSDGPTEYTHSENSPGSVPWTPVYSKLPWCPQAPFLQYPIQNAGRKMVPAPVMLPELSRWECEVNAPLGPSTQLLQGTELTTVLDQVAPGVPWYQQEQCNSIFCVNKF